MGGVILDTSFVEDVGRDDPAALSKAGDIEEAGIPQRLSVMTVYELYWGVGYLDTPAAEKRRIDAVIQSKETYRITAEIARKAGRIAGTLSADGKPLNDPGDEIIGATGVVRDEPVLTGNPDHFRRVPGLEVETY